MKLSESLKYAREVSLSQGEVQQLLHILRVQLDTATFSKDLYKEDVADLWLDCDKSDEGTRAYFKAFSNLNSAYKKHKQEEKKLVSLITKLKGLR